jgi:hypothetical protein
MLTIQGVEVTTLPESHFANHGSELQNIIGPLLGLASLTHLVLDALSSNSKDDIPRERMLVVQDLTSRLEQWRVSCKIPIRSIDELQGTSQLSDPAQTCLQACYYQILMLIHRTSITSPPRTNMNIVFGHDMLEEEVRNSKEFGICVKAARETIKLVRNIPAEFEGFLRFVINIQLSWFLVLIDHSRSLSVHVVRAATIVCMNIMHVRPHSADIDDYALLCSAQTFLSNCARRSTGSKSSIAASNFGFCIDLVAAAERSINSTQW